MLLKHMQLTEYKWEDKQNKNFYFGQNKPENPLKTISLHIT